MKKTTTLAFILAILSSPGFCLAEVPHRVGPFVLNQNIADFKDDVIMETALPIRYMEDIEEVEIKPIEGFKSGLIAYATCAAPGHIVRIKLKYADSSKKFFDELLQRTKERFGEPDEYVGDPFHVLIAWKWSFVDKDGRDISLILQHNTLDEEEKIGNAVKLTLNSLIEKDRACYRQKNLDLQERLRQRKWKVIVPKEKGWNLFVPQ
jgi:hypothetical protein